MTGRFSCVLLVALITSAISASPAVANDTIRIRDVDADKFPRVAATISIESDGKLSPDDIAVTENGTVPPDLKVTPLMDAGGEIEIVLAIDTSGSMRGAPMAAAIEAALGFVRDLPEEIRVGILTFSSAPTVALGITEDHSAALRVTRSVEATGETSLYDGVIAAARMFGAKGQRNIVLLSDGGDTASSGDMNRAVSAAQQHGAAVFTIGLKTPETDVGVLRRIAQRSGGRYQAAEAADLSGIYTDLATVLAHQYVASYTSGVDQESQISLTASIPGAEDEVLFLAPATAEAAQEPPQVVAVEESEPLLRDGWGIALVLLLSFLALFFLFFMLLGRQARVSKQRRLAKRLLAKPSDGASKDEVRDGSGLTGWIPRPVSKAADRFVAARGMTERLDRKLERAGMAVKPGEFLALMISSGLGGLMVGLLLGRGPISAIIGAVLGSTAMHLWVSGKISRRTKQMQAQLPDVLMVLASSLRAGRSFLQALDEVANETPDPAKGEFKRAVAEIRLGRAVDEALNDLADRIDSEDFKWAVLAVGIQREVGGNMAEVLDTVANTLRERDNVKRQVAVLSAEGRISAWVLSLLPILLGAYMAAARPEAFGLMFTTSLGIAMLGGAIILMVVGILWIRKTVKIDV